MSGHTEATLRALQTVCPRLAEMTARNTGAVIAGSTEKGS
jgi:hypothetical protein